MIEIHVYNPAWPALFEAERARIAAALGDRLAALEHVGSTSVPGLAAKPIIDILAGVVRLEQAGACIEPIVALGYTYRPDLETVMPERRFFCRETDGVRSHNLHLVAIDSEFWERHLLFRDYLRARPRVAAHYETLKRVLRDRFVDDMGAYTDNKTPFIRQVEELARAEREGRLPT
ncbi:MAG TPA: GrpB family protein [Oscillatoriaceae cyanobacterium]